MRLKFLIVFISFIVAVKLEKLNKISKLICLLAEEETKISKTIVSINLQPKLVEEFLLCLPKNISKVLFDFSHKIEEPKISLPSSTLILIFANLINFVSYKKI